MLRSMFTAISSLSMHQQYMDVIADNLANANTYGFKTSRVSFQDQFAQVLSWGAAPSGTQGGVNPTQIGLGLQIGGITANFSQGMLQNTGRSTDIAVQGDGFFIYSNGEADFYSRDGAIEIDSEGYLVNAATGMRLQGWEVVTSGSTRSIDTGLAIDDIKLPVGSAVARPTTNTIMGGNLDATTATGDYIEVTTGAYDSLGVLHNATIRFTKNAAAGEWDWIASGPNVSGNGQVTFNPDGSVNTSTGGPITITAGGGADDITVSLDLSPISQLASQTTIMATSQDGMAAGSLTSFFITENTGEIVGLYSNGLQNLLGQVALANFVNPVGLVRQGQNLFMQGPNSGEPMVGTVNSGGRGSVVTGYLEGSNVDLAQEFTNMILAQRGFQASARVITTSDEMLAELVNIKR